MVPVVVAGIIVMDVLMLGIVVFISVIMRVSFYIFSNEHITSFVDLKTVLMFYC